MKNSERLISFLSMTLQRCASLCQYRQTNKDEDYEAGITEKQSLQTALGLITTVVTASNVQVFIDLIIFTQSVVSSQYNSTYLFTKKIAALIYIL